MTTEKKHPALTEQISANKLYVRNSLSGKKELFQPRNFPKVTMYACGVTTYDHCHIGHALQALTFQMIKKYLEYLGYQVTYVRNYTDVDDKIIKRAAELGLKPLELASQMIEASQLDFEKLGIHPADHEPKVSEMIPEIISMIEKLIARGHAYATPEGHVYYSLKTKPDYGKLSHRNPDDMRHETRDVETGGKKQPLDFALWKHEEMPDSSWDSPWGKGRPGWHIECSAMIKAILGDRIDIHGGGRDLIFPHHENEIAQSECFCPSPWVKYWLHSGLLTIDQQKMSKSLGNHISIQEFLHKRPAEVLKFCLLQHHYRQDVNFSENVFNRGEKLLIYYYQIKKDLYQIKKNHQISHHQAQPAEFTPENLENVFCRAMNDDFNTVVLLSDLHRLFKQTQKLLKNIHNQNSPDNRTIKAVLNFLEFLDKISDVTGILREDPHQFITEAKARFLVSQGIKEDWLHNKIEQRQMARLNQDWQKADFIRDELDAHGIEIQDTSSSSEWTVRLD
ncbi:MAG: cysteine--tRNA ligase [Proteobacteria bacterium]|nr:cysteine--tRNA ligase [Pseudomonadota bacterium]